MRRAVLAVLGTVAGTALLVGAKLGDGPAADPDTVALGDAGAGQPSTQPSIQPGPGRTKATPTQPAGGSGLHDGTFTGAGKPARQFEIVTVTVTVAGGRLTAATGGCGTASGESRRICTRAVARLQQQALTVQSAKVDAITGATYTSEAYASSLQSAIDQAKR
jgi:uncharacterized protein with FMN-binding domain